VLLGSRVISQGKTPHQGITGQLGTNLSNKGDMTGPATDGKAVNSKSNLSCFSLTDA